jgi:hypothetical protein
MMQGPIPTHQHEYMQELCQVGEPGVALGLFATQLYEYDAKIESEMIDEIESLGSEMGLDSKYWKRLRSQIGRAR